jgi:hypothetical protein
MFLGKKLAAGKKIRNLWSKCEKFIVFVKTVSNERIWYRYSIVTRATLVFTGNEVIGTIFSCLCNGSDGAEKIFYASVMVTI